jgi:hypothetical protein
MSDDAGVLELMARTERHAGATDVDLDALRRISPGELPQDYLSFLRWSDGAEGYVAGHGYLRLWSAQDAIRFNAAYRIAEFVPGLLLFGTDASVMGYGFDWSAGALQIVDVELAALDREYVREVADSFAALIRLLASAPLPPGATQPTDHGPPDWLRGQVVHEKHPSVLGGPGGDPDNRVVVPADKHPELCVFFARTLRVVREEAKSRSE